MQAPRQRRPQLPNVRHEEQQRRVAEQPAATGHHTDPTSLTTANEILDYMAWARMRCCGFCAGTGRRWSRAFRSMEVCTVCRGTGRGSPLVEPGDVHPDEVIGALQREYRALRSPQAS
ncbi:MAG: hypothetical protein AB7L13_25010 [Acidimicrobiia bacterium]